MKTTAEKQGDAMPYFVVSACLAGHRCRYDGTASPCPQVQRLVALGLALPLCPECLGGLPTPRAPGELRGGRVFTMDGQDISAAFERGAALALHAAQQQGCRAAILKARSPSCGISEVYDGAFCGKLVPGQGLWARALRRAGLELFSEETLPPEAEHGTAFPGCGLT